MNSSLAQACRQAGEPPLPLAGHALVSSTGCVLTVLGATHPSAFPIRPMPCQPSLTPSTQGAAQTGSVEPCQAHSRLSPTSFDRSAPDVFLSPTRRHDSGIRCSIPTRASLSAACRHMTAEPSVAWP